MSKTQNRVLSLEEWEAEGEKLFGPDRMKWKFRCCCCGHIQCQEDIIKLGGKFSAYYSCIGRLMVSCRQALGEGPGPCNYAGGGLFGLHPVTVKTEAATVAAFEFAVPAEVQR